ncbi:winged helix-turn-helix domain-containing protein [bacterium]|nr:winged helix-turn-helix domain-containing protein [bacterium]
MSKVEVLNALIRQILVEREQVKQKLEPLQKRLEQLNSVVQYIEESADVSFDSYQEQSTIETPFTSANQVPSQKYKNIPMIQAAEKVLRENGKPMHMKDIIQGILDGGYEQQKDPKRIYQSLYSTMSKRKPEVFYKIKNKQATFGLSEWKEKDSAPSAK